MAERHVRRFDGVAVVGAGAAGISAAVEAARLGAGALILEASGLTGGVVRLAHEVRNFPGGARSGAEIAGMFGAQVVQWGIPVERRLVRIVEARAGRVILADGGGWAMEAGAAVVATGTVPVMPEIPGMPASFEPGCGVFSSACSALAGDPPHSAVVIGGSDVAFDQARLLASRGVATSVLCRRSAPSAPRWLVEAARIEGVSILAGLRVSRACGRAGAWRLETTRSGVRAEGPVLLFDSVVVAAGRTPVLPAMTCGDSPLVMVAGDALGRPGRYLSAAMADGCLAARSLLCGGGRAEV